MLIVYTTIFFTKNSKVQTVVCSICGIVNFSLGNVSRQIPQEMVNTIMHQGPYDSGIYTSGPAGLGHTSLGVIDLSQNGHKLRVAQDHSCVLVFNRELYNYLNLKHKFEGKSHSFVKNTYSIKPLL